MRTALICAAVGLLALGAFGQWSNPAMDVPAYHSGPATPGTPLPPILSGKRLTESPFVYRWQRVVYQDAAKVPNVLYQLPCLCRCDRALGHTSLRSCFEGLHGAECSTCAKEAYYAYLMTKKGKSVQEIRAGIMHNDFEQVSLEALGK